MLVSAGGPPQKVCRAPVRLPGNATFRIHAPSGALVNSARIEFNLELPPEAPSGLQALFYVRDWDYFWYQKLLPVKLVPGRRQRLAVDISPDSRGWEPRGHQGGWNLRVLADPIEVAFRVFGSSTGETWCAVGDLAAVPRDDSRPPFISNVRPAADRVAVYEKFEVRFDVPDRYPNPFDGEQVAVSAVIRPPDGAEVTVDGFYSQDFYRETGATGDQLFPQGRPCWLVRYSPRIEGRHSYRLRIRDARGRAEWGPGFFEATAPSSPGYVRVSVKDRRFFEFESGSPFFPIGHNIRSPFDTRHNDLFPWKRRWIDGSSVYTRYFSLMAANGENLTEIWSSAWSLGLEWSPMWKGYHGIGQYNMLNAWEMDKVLEDAGANGIYVNLVVHNHGKFGSMSDAEWHHNPFNVELGGYLSNPEDYFTNPRAIKDFLNLMKYMVARWGYSTSIFAWELWSELNLTGASRDFYRKQEVVDWHRLMGRAVEDMDFNRHMVSTHFSGDYTVQNTNIVGLEEMDLAPVDAYHGSTDPLAIVDLMLRTAEFNRKFGKPVLITEFGGSHIAQGAAHLEDSLHAALWCSPCVDVGGVPMMWWWMFIDEENLYPLFSGVSRFMAGEDRRDPSMKTCYALYMQNEEARGTGGVRLRAGEQRPDHTGVWCSKNDARALGWIARTRDYQSINPAGPPTATNMVLILDSMSPGAATIEFWDTRSGTPLLRTRAAVEGESVSAPVPPFARDIAFKVIPTR